MISYFIIPWACVICCVITTCVCHKSESISDFALHATVSFIFSIAALAFLSIPYFFKIEIKNDELTKNKARAYD